MRAVTSPVAGSTRSIWPDWVTTQSDPNANRSSHGVESSFVREATLFVAGSIRSSSALSASVTQTLPAAPAMPHGLPPVEIFATTAADSRVAEPAVPQAIAPATRRNASGAALRMGATVGAASCGRQLFRRREDQVVDQ